MINLKLGLWTIMLLISTLAGKSAFAEENFFTQKLNHLDKTDQRKFNQRYYVDSSFAVGASAPVFLIIGYEGAISEDYAKKSQIYVFAKQMGAHIVKIEHRYYGKSSPFNLLSPENLRYLTWEQALFDYASIVTDLKNNLKLTGPWIAVGSSYAATLATFMRLKYPNLIRAAIGYSEVNLLLTSSKWKPDGSAELREEFASRLLDPQCLENLKQVKNELETKFYNSSELKELKGIFEVDQGTDLDFLAAIADMTLVLTQWDSKLLCQRLAQQPELKMLEKLNALAVEVLKEWGIKVKEFALSLASQVVEQDSKENSNLGARQIEYQHCSQFNQPFIAASKDRDVTMTSALVNLDYQKEFCQTHFKIKNPFESKMLKKADRLVQLLLSEKSSGIVFINGGIDHWILASVTSMQEHFKRRLSPNNLYITLPEGGHSPTWVAEGPNTPESGKKARAETLAFIKKHLGMSKDIGN